MNSKPTEGQPTPGSWTFEAEPNGLTFTIWQDDDTQIAEAQTEAYARLIAAAPELLAALRGLVCELDSVNNKAPGLIHARKAIAGATLPVS